jgi:hypothetical protein
MTAVTRPDLPGRGLPYSMTRTGGEAPSLAEELRAVSEKTFEG